ncbi:uncharacterized protein LOC122263251 [Penaeus japonicus]|uniref:uncharacterized protein LOC122263251 n=1 Tax=Penaeus japonicus TaxID=27405 RepID=UPI001C70FD9B|nr:uncharacterized protein LOC122263251 [Penaeus japonicus]
MEIKNEGSAPHKKRKRRRNRNGKKKALLPTEEKNEGEVVSTEQTEDSENKNGTDAATEEQTEAVKKDNEASETSAKETEVKKKKRSRGRRKKSTPKNVEGEAADGLKRKNPDDDGTNQAKKAKIEEIVPDEKMTLDGDLLAIHEMRRDELFSRALYVMMKNFKRKHIRNPPPILGKAQHFRFCGLKGLIYLEFKTEKEAEKMKAVFENHRLIQDARFAGMKGCYGTKREEVVVHPYKLDIENIPDRIRHEDLANVFQTAWQINYIPGNCYANLVYKTKEEAEEAFRESENIEIKDIKLTVFYRKYDKGKGRPERTPKPKIKKKHFDIDYVLS